MTGQTTRPEDVATIEPSDVGRWRDDPRRPCLTILHHTDLDRVGDRLWLFVEENGPVGLSRLAPDFVRQPGITSGPLAEPCLSRKALWFSRAPERGIALAPENGASEVRVDGRKLVGPRELSAADLEWGVQIELAARVLLLLHSSVPRQELQPALGFVGESDALELLRRQIVTSAPIATPVLLRGETGSGKELAAQALHRCSGRADGPLVAVNMAAVPGSTAASELFGHMAGAFTGAAQEHRGYFEQAHGGTLFLDEIGATPPDVQAMLLRTLETGTIRRLGSSAEQAVDVRVIAATDEDLDARVRDGGFRAPLLHRLSGCTLHLPALSQRRDDIGRLFRHFVRHELELCDALALLEPRPGGAAPWMPAAVVAQLVACEWPGNVRQLRNVTRQLVLANLDSDTVPVDSAVALLREAASTVQPREVPASQRPASEIDEDQLVATLQQHGHQIRATADALGISRNTLYALMERSPRVRKARDIGAEEITSRLAELGGDLGAAAESLGVSRRALTLRVRELGLKTP
ncbi:MAG: sigma 54-interacting transcriptional regulator [Pseudomonadota bacterium]